MVVAVLLSTGTALAQLPEAIPALVIGPPGEGIRELFAHPDDWARARQLTGALLCADHTLDRFSDAELRTWFATMRSWNMRLELEVGAIKEWGPTADSTFRAEQPIWDRALRLGADLRSVVMDEPLVAARALGHRSDLYAVEETARFVGLVRQHYPALHIGDIEPYPAISLQDQIAWLDQLQARLRREHGAGLDLYRADVDWVAFAKAGRGNWREVATLAAAARGAGVPFSLIYWASGYPSEQAVGVAGDDTWYVEVMGQGYAAIDAGVMPDQFVIESWIDAPALIVPDRAEFSFTRSVVDFGRKFIGSRGAGLAGQTGRGR